MLEDLVPMACDTSLAAADAGRPYDAFGGCVVPHLSIYPRPRGLENLFQYDSGPLQAR